jgi:hypothetical protein
MFNIAMPKLRLTGRPQSIAAKPLIKRYSLEIQKGRVGLLPRIRSVAA